MTALELLRAGNLADCLKAVQGDVRAQPAEARHRVFLFQLLAVNGDWERALTQLNVAADLAPANLLMAQVCRPALACEAFRAEVFAGNRAPLVLGQPDPWLGWMIEALAASARGRHDAAADLRARALEAAPATPGAIDGHAFEWIADADSRLGPVLEAIVEGKYYWVPFCNITRIDLEPPADLRDLVWAPAQFTWANGGQSVGLIPSRYPGTQSAADPALRLARKTEWAEDQPGVYRGQGTRILATDAGEYPLLEVRALTIGDQPPPAAA
jgi:type VI secretion system protein ImpE